MTDPINVRKTDHLKAIAQDPEIERKGSGFDRLRLTHRALPEISLDAIDTSVRFLDKTLSFPLLISSMTGGEGEEINQINRNLAAAAEATGVAMAVGSQRVMFSTPAARASFELREAAPNAVLISNIGAVQLNEGMGAEECAEAVQVLGADGIYLHLNPLQEAIQPEGDRNFAGLGAKIAEVVEALEVPVLLKEVGSGLSPQDIARGLEAGVTHFDLAGRGGTSWSRIEYHRRADEADDLGLVFQDWGLTTVEALTYARRELATHPHCTLIASGGVRNGIDMAKAVVLGASVAGMAAPFLEAAKISTEAVISRIDSFRREYTTAMFLLGCDKTDMLRGNTNLILGELT